MILIVEDNPQLAEVFRKAIETTGREVTIAPTGTAALHALATAPCELALVDLALPDMNGVDLVVRARQAGNDVPVIGISGAKDLMDPAALRPAGFAAVLGKPLLVTELLAVVEQYARPVATA